MHCSAISGIIHPMSNEIHHEITLPDELGGLRLDQALSKFLPQYSRTQIQDWIKLGSITLNESPAKSKYLVVGGEKVLINAVLKPQQQWEAQDINLDIIFEDDSLLIINKPINMVIHPGVGNLSNTLLNALLHHVPELQNLPRAGIVHRLDKNTSGLLVVAKTAQALQSLNKQLKERTISRIYQAVVVGDFTGGGKVDAPIGRHPVQRKRMAVVDNGKPALTHYRIIERYRGHTRLKVQLETGRTHQIRVHLSHIHHPIVGDSVYGGRLQLPKGATQPLIDMLRTFKRQALHAYELGLQHPVTQELLTWRAPLPDDMQALIDVMRNDKANED